MEIDLTDKFILDVCCGPKHFWFDKNHPNVIYMDIREEDKGFIDNRPKCEIKPDFIGDFRNLPFEDETFKLVVMDPPHIHSAGELFKMTKRYGKLDKQTWWWDIRKGVEECWRVLEPYGIFIFKWNETQIKRHEILNAVKFQPLFGHPMLGNKTHWFCFMKIPERGGQEARRNSQKKHEIKSSKVAAV